MMDPEDGDGHDASSKRKPETHTYSLRRSSRRRSSDPSQEAPPPPEPSRQPPRPRPSGRNRQSAAIPRQVAGYDLKVPEQAGIAGQLLRVKLVNFMCHEHFEVYFGNHVNFVTGKNGSGKSAILQAIQLCFGSKAFDTGRGKNLRGFVMTGKHYAKMSISVWNTGPKAFHEADFGRVITVERTFSSTSGSYTLINERGFRVSTHKRDVDELVSAFNIFLKNPMVVLTQGAASSFLRGRKLESDLFNLYMKATNFEETAEVLTESFHRIQSQKEHIQTAKATIEELKEHKDDLEVRLARAQEERRAVECLKHAMNAQFYIALKEKIEMLHQREASADEEKESFESLEEEVHQKQLAVDRATAEREEFNEDVQAATIRQMLNTLRTEESNLREQKRAAEKACKEPKKRIMALQNEIGRLQRDIAEKETHIETLRNDDGEEIRAAKEEFGNEMQEKEECIRHLQSQYFVHQTAVRELREVIDKKETAVKKTMDVYEEHSGDVQRLEEDLRHLRGTQRDPLTKFGGQPMKNLLTAIHRNKDKFEFEPIGPIGRYLSVRDEKWSQAIEYSIGQIFNDFIVHSPHDEKLLRTLCARMNINLRFRAIIYRFDNAPYNLGAYERPPHQTILRMLQIEEFQHKHVLCNVLIDHGSVERVVLCSSEDEALQIISNNDQSFAPAYVRLPTGRKVYRRRNAKMSVHDGRKLQPRLVKDISQQIRRAEHELVHHKELLSKKKDERKEQQKELQSLNKRLDEAERDAHNIEQSGRIELDGLKQLQERGPALPAYAAFDIESLQEEIQKVIKNVQETESKVNDAEGELAYKEQLVKATDERIAQHKVEFQAKKAHTERLSAQMNAILTNCRATASALEKAQESLQQKQSQVENLTAELTQFNEEIAELEAKATARCNQEEGNASAAFMMNWMSEGRSEEAGQALTSIKVEMVMTDLNRKIRNFRLHCNDNFDELTNEHMSVTAQIDEMEASLVNLEHICAEAETGQKKRSDVYRQNQKRMDASINTHFSRYMRMRRFQGKLKTNHRNKTIDITVRLSGQDENVRDMASLSGGERSFTTVCLLLALASVVDSPFHCMDEFDVFTDMMTKQCSIKALLETAAVEKTNSQFIFFSPQEVGVVEDVRRMMNIEYMEHHPEPLIPPDFIMIYHMAAPQRQAMQNRAAQPQ